MHIEEVSGVDGFLQLGSLWDEFCRENGHNSWFLSHSWFRCCVSGMAPGIEPLVLLARDGGAVVGIVPLLAQRASWRIFPAHLLSLMQNQDSPFADMLLSHKPAKRVLAAILDHLHARSGWHLWCAAKIDRASATASLLADCLNRMPHLRIAEGRSPILNVDGDWETFWKGQSQRFKKTVRNVVNRVERLGRIEIINQAEHGTDDECMEVFRDVGATSWKAKLAVSVTRNAGIARFFQALTSALHARGQLALWVLRLNGVPIATEYHVRDGDTIYALRSDFDERYRDASPGAHLNAFIVRTYFEGDVRVYDMGPGDSEYKQRLANSAMEQETFWLFNRTPYGLALYNMECRAVPRLRRTREWWRKSGK